MCNIPSTNTDPQYRRSLKKELEFILEFILRLQDATLDSED